MRKQNIYIIDRIKDIQWNYTTQQIKDLLRKEGIRVSKTTISKHIDHDRLILITCKKCWWQFLYSKYRKYCEVCSWYINVHKVINNKYVYKRELKEMMLETIRITWLDKNKILRLLQNNTHTEIRNHYTILRKKK